MAFNRITTAHLIIFFSYFQSWLLSDPHMEPRSMYPPFIEAVDQFYKRFLPILVPLQVMYMTNKTWKLFSVYFLIFVKTTRSASTKIKPNFAWSRISFILLIKYQEFRPSTWFWHSVNYPWCIEQLLTKRW